MKLCAYVEIRSQKSVGSSNNDFGGSCFGGPDTRFAVQVVPEGVEKLKVLDQRIAKKRGIEIIYFGEGYRKNQGSKSSYGKNLLEAEKFAKDFNRHQYIINQLLW